MVERLITFVLKTKKPERVSRVQISPLPPVCSKGRRGGFQINPRGPMVSLTLRRVEMDFVSIFFGVVSLGIAHFGGDAETRYQADCFGYAIVV